MKPVKITLRREGDEGGRVKVVNLMGVHCIHAWKY
jgi:hypothetical protein